TEIEATTGKLPHQLVVDAGFTTREAILAADERHFDLIGSFPDAKAGRETSLRSRGIDEAFWPDKFRFDPERNAYICPEGKPAPFKGRSIKRGKTIFHYRGKGCKGCPRSLPVAPGPQRGAISPV